MMKNQAKQGGIKMRAIVDNLLTRLSERGVLLAQVPRFVKDVLTIVNDSLFPTLFFINDRLEGLGWGGQVLDEFTLELILYLLENQGTGSYGVPVDVTAFQEAW